MSKIVELKELNDSVDSSKYEMARGDTASLLRGWRRELLFHPLAVEIPTQNFQPTQDRTNENINIYFLINSIYEGNYFFTRMDKRGKRGLSFSEPSNNFVDGIDFQSLHEGSTSTWTENFAEIKTIPKIQRGSNSIIERLKKFATLEAGWDSYDAKPIRWSTIIRAIQFFSNVLYVVSNENKDIVPPFIAPLSDGGIQFEWNTCYKGLIHSIPEKEEEPLEYLKVDKISGEDKEKEKVVYSIDDMVDVVIEWLL